jgi:ATP-dependent Lhr-like helicase
MEAERARELLGSLQAEGRVVEIELPGGARAWIPAIDGELYRSLTTSEGLERVLLRFLRTRGPRVARALAARYGVAEEDVLAVLDHLVARGVVRRGEFLDDAPAPQYVHVAVLDDLQRRQVHARRLPRAVATAEQFSAFLLRRHHLHPAHRVSGPSGVLAALELLQGEDFAPRVWEQDLLPPRVEAYEREWLDRLGLTGDIVWTTFEPSARTSSGRVGVALRENLAWLTRSRAELPDLDPTTKEVLRQLELRGASFAQDLARLTRLDTARVLAALWQLFWVGLVTPDTFTGVVAGTTPSRRPDARGGRRRQRGRFRGLLPELPLVGRWSALGDEEHVSPEERDEARARLLLARYGVVSRELAGGNWSALRHALLRMEYGGETVRGYFVEGLSGEQYALEETLSGLEQNPRRAEPHVLVNIVDPANVWGQVFGLTRTDGSRASVAGQSHAWLVFRAGRPVLLAEGHGRDLTTLAGWEPADLHGVVKALQSVVDRPLMLRPVRRLEVLTLDGRPIGATRAVDALAAAGFTVDADRLSWDGHPGPRVPR